MKTNDLDALRHADPAAQIPDGPLTERELAGLARIQTRLSAEQHVAPHNAASAARGRGRPGRRRVVAFAAVAAVTVAGGGLVVADPFGATGVAVAATPPLLDDELAAGRPAKSELDALAAKVARDTTLPGDEGGTHVVRTESWYLATDVDGKRVTSAVVPTTRVLSWNSDLSGHLVVRAGRPWFPDDPSYRKAWAHEGGPGMPEGKVIDEQTWTRGSYQPSFGFPLASDPRRLLAQLKVGHPVDVDGTGQLTSAIVDVYRETVPAPAVRAGLLSVLSGRGDVVALGSITDRAGRTGRGFAIDTTYTGLPQRHLLVFDPATGTLLAQEEILTKTAGKLNVRVPSVIGYTLYR